MGSPGLGYQGITTLGLSLELLFFVYSVLKRYMNDVISKPLLSCFVCPVSLEGQEILFFIKGRRRRSTVSASEDRSLLLFHHFEGAWF